ncbi:hypothetical protein MKX01_020424, partial [Papaver californicum]
MTTSLLPSAISIHKEGKSLVSLKETSYMGTSVCEHLNTEFNATILRSKTAVMTPAMNRASQENKKTLRKGSVVITGASSGL